jgi:hypothetical protein
MAMGAVLFIAVVIAAIRQSPGMGGLLSGLFSGLFMGLLVMAAGGWAAMWLMKEKTVPPPLDEVAANALVEPLVPVLAELEQVRLDVVRQVNARAAWRVPLGAAGGMMLWIVGLFGDDPGGLFDLILTTAIGGVAGYVWASHALSQRYRRLYKDRVLPRLAERFGAITYRAAAQPDMARLRREHIFREFEDVTAEDELVGTHRGLAIRIVELTLTKGSGDDRRTMFDGLLLEVDLPRQLRGTTAVVADNGMFGNLRDWAQRGEHQRVRVEHPRFESVYQVWGTDQIAARALLTPAFMERFMALGALAGFGRPLALAQDNRLMLALPKADGRNLFEPPGYRKPAASRAVLMQLDKDISALLATADSVIDLDQAARNVAASAGGGGG